ncbi:hypothetical protein SASPL_122324 [Salvia splendens]|uniref:Amino acid transporter transmembrane domain-containing protein n=1 Tax=Salvia splendens TaxID=180675 RepID=A0A8X8XI58_SALSN|nr:hypothetical protein SASPL_122324 [Salvia splendens]
MWSCFAAIGNIAFAYAFVVVLIEIQDTIRAGSLTESKPTHLRDGGGVVRAGNKLLSKEYKWWKLRLSPFRVVWRSLYVVFTTFVAMMLPFFNDFVGLLGAISFWPLAVFFPIEMYMVRTGVSRSSCRGLFLQVLSGFCLVASLLAAVGSVRGLIQSLRTFQPLQSRS